MCSQPVMIIAAHDQPAHLRRLIDALDPLPTYLHVDANVADAAHAELTADLPSRVRLLPRHATPWAGFGLVAAELEAYRTALEETDAEHFVFLSGADYPMVEVDRISRLLADNPGRSFGEMQPLPIDRWGLLRGYDRFAMWQVPRRRRRVVLPVPLRRPAGLRPAGGSAWKILCRRHATQVVETFASNPRLVEFFRRCWAPDEIAIQSVLFSPGLGGESGDDWLGPSPWWINWPGGRASGPHLITDWAQLPQQPDPPTPTVLFARKFGDESGPVLDRIDEMKRLSAS